MKEHLHVLFIAIFLSLTGCARQLPVIHPGAAGQTLATICDCRHRFPQGRWQLFHIIHATVPGGQESTLTGVSVVSSQERSIRWALMTVEGFVLFSGRYDGELTIQRAIAPFDRPGFAHGLMDDLTMLFLEPKPALRETGILENNGRVCRYGLPENSTDVVLKADGTWSVRQYTQRLRLSRTIEATEMTSVGRHVFAKHLILKTPGALGYRLELELVEAVPLE